MISATAGELADLLKNDRRESFRVRIADHTDTLQDVSADVLSVDVTIDVNTPSRSANVRMKLGDRSPFLSNPTIYPRRRVVIDMEVRKHDEALGSSWIEVFNGLVTVPKLNPRQDQVFLPCQDYWLNLYNALIETEANYGSGGGTAIATVIQSLLDDTLGSGVYTLSTIGTPTTTIVTYAQRRMKLSQALTDVANVNAWDLRFIGTTLTFQEPPRSKATPDYTFTTDGFFDLPYMALDPSGIVNRVLGQWDDSNTEVGEDSTSVAAWGEIAAYIDARQDPQFTSAPVMQALVDIIVSDRANPLTEWQVKGRLFPFAELWDLYRFPALSNLTSGNTDLAVSKIVHSFPGFGQMPHTMLYLSGSPSGGVDRWDRLITKTQRAQVVTDVTGPVTGGTDTIVPTVGPLVGQVAGVGTLTLNTNDPDGHINATSFEVFLREGDFAPDADPANWSGYDNSAPYTLTQDADMTDGADRSVAWAVRYNLGSGNVWIPGVHEFDADNIANAAPPVLGFDDDGIPLVFLAGDEDTVGVVCSIAVGSDPNAPVELGSSTLSGDEAAGQTVLSVNSVTGAVAGEYGYISNGSTAEVFYISSVGASTITIGAGLANSYLTGDTVGYFDYTGGTTNEYGGGVLAQSGTVKIEASATGPEQTLNVAIGEEVRIIARAVGVKGLGPASGVVRRRRGDTEFIKPAVQVQATRSGSDVSVDFVITDPTLAITATPSYKRRDGDDQSLDVAWQTSWNTNTGTAGTDADLIRKVTLSDPYTAIVWRIQYTDENGDAQEIGDELDLASVQELAKTAVISPADFSPATSSENYTYSTSAGIRGLRIRNTAADNLELVANLTLPPGVTLNEIRAYCFESGSGVATTYLYEDNSALATIAATGTGEDSASLSATVAVDSLYYLLWIGQNAATNETGLDYVEIDYDSPSFAQTY
jgi:hypothetical protein